MRKDIVCHVRTTNISFFVYICACAYTNQMLPSYKTVRCNKYLLEIASVYVKKLGCLHMPLVPLVAESLTSKAN